MPAFDNLLIVVAIAFAAPFLLGFFPSVKLPSVVLEILAGIVVGPVGAGDRRSRRDDLGRLRARPRLPSLSRRAGDRLLEAARAGAAVDDGGFVLSFGLAFLVSLGLKATGLIETPLLIAIILCATSLGVLIPVLKDAGEISSTFGQLIVAAGTIADFGAVILLSIFFSGEGDVGSTLLLIGSLVLLAVVVFIAVKSAGAFQAAQAGPGPSSGHDRADPRPRRRRPAGRVRRDRRPAGLESILGAFIAGAILSLLDRDEAMTHPEFRRKLEAVGFGVFIPVFFVTSGVNYDLDALLSSASNVLMVPIFLAALVAARGLPALMYRRLLDGRHTMIAGLMQATSLPFIVAAVAIGEDLDLVTAAEGAALIGAGLLSVLLFPVIGLGLLKRGDDKARAPETEESDALMAM